MRYALDNMDKQEIQQLIRNEIQAASLKALYSVSNVPYHVHNGIDTPKLGFIGLGDTPATYSAQAGKIANVNSIETALQFSTMLALNTVANGGTGRASATAYAVITGGTTSTGAQQSVSGVGTLGQVLTSNGASALPTWQGPKTYGGVVTSTGTAGTPFPSGWTAGKNATGDYTVTHNLGTTNYVVVGSAISGGKILLWSQSSSDGNQFNILTFNTAGTSTDTTFSFILALTS